MGVPQMDGVQWKSYYIKWMAMSGLHLNAICDDLWGSGGRLHLKLRKPLLTCTSQCMNSFASSMS